MTQFNFDERIHLALNLAIAHWLVVSCNVFSQLFCVFYATL